MEHPQRSNQKNDIITAVRSNVEADHEKPVEAADHVPIQLMAVDKLSVWQAVWLYKRIGLFCFLASLTASLDGYQGELQGGPGY